MRRNKLPDLRQAQQRAITLGAANLAICTPSEAMNLRGEATAVTFVNHCHF